MSVLEEIRTLLSNKLNKLERDLEAAKSIGDFGSIEIIERQIEETKIGLEKIS